MTKDQISAVLEKIRSWPKADQEELAEVARAIEARRSEIYELTGDERAAIDRARRSRLMTDDEVKAFWKSLGIE